MKRLPATLEDTGLLSYVVADRVIAELETHLGIEIPDRRNLADRLSERAECIYRYQAKKRTDWAKRLNRGNRGLDMFYAFMRHWLSGELCREPIFERIPDGFKMGRPL